MKRLLPLLLILPSCLVGCNNTNSETTVTSHEDYINVSTREVSVMEGKTFQIEVEILKPRTIVFYSSSDTSVATVDENGLITGIKEGQTTIIVRGGRDSIAIDVVVTPYQAEEVLQITLVKTSFTLQVGDVFTLPFVVRKGNTIIEDASFSYEVGNPSIVSFAGKEATALSVGTSKCVATASKDGEKASIGFTIAVY